MGDENKPDQSKWSQYLQFLWALLGDGRRLIGLVVLLVVLGAICKGSIEALWYSIEQHLPKWERALGISVGVGFCTAGSLGWPVFRNVYRKWRRLRSGEPLSEGVPPSKSITQAPGKQQDDTLGEPGEHQGEHAGDRDPGADSR